MSSAADEWLLLKGDSNYGVKCEIYKKSWYMNNECSFDLQLTQNEWLFSSNYICNYNMFKSILRNPF